MKNIVFVGLLYVYTVYRKTELTSARQADSRLKYQRDNAFGSHRLQRAETWQQMNRN